MHQDFKWARGVGVKAVDGFHDWILTEGGMGLSVVLV